MHISEVMQYQILHDCNPLNDNKVKKIVSLGQIATIEMRTTTAATLYNLIILILTITVKI